MTRRSLHLEEFEGFSVAISADNLSKKLLAPVEGLITKRLSIEASCSGMTRHWQMYGNRGDLMDSLLQVNRTNQLPMLLGWLILRPRTVAE